jgi:porphobilinogen synthase
MTKHAFPITRLRRLRRTSNLRALLAENMLHLDDLILPLFIKAGEGKKQAIQAMPGHYQLTLRDLPEEISTIVALGIKAIILFGIPARKDPSGSESFDPEGIVQKAIREVKRLAPELLVIADTCLCEYTDHGHCGWVDDRTGILDVENDKTLTLLAKQAVAQAEAGADMVAPSGMIDGMVRAIRFALDEAGYEHLPILSYTVKYASAFYAPFREAACGAPTFGDRKTYQMSPTNGEEAILEATQDLQEGADLLMVKPAIGYLDVLYRITQLFPGVPVAAYHVSGEFAMLKAAAQAGWLDEKAVVMEHLVAIKRAGARVILTYYAKEVAKWLKG